MSPYELISLAVWSVGSVAVIVSLYWVNRQTSLFAKQTEYVARSLMESMAANMNSQSQEVSRIFIQYPELRPFFYNAQTIEENNPDYYRAEAVAELMLDIFWTMFTQSQRVEGGFIPKDPERLWASFVGDAFAQSPLLVKTLMRRQNWYGKAMVDQMKAGLQRQSLTAAQ